MRVLIIEDEKPAAEKLALFIKKYNPDVKIEGPLTSIQDSVKYLDKNGSEIDLIFQDIQLVDGISFDIFKQIKVKTPIIFTTAYNEYALNAFEVNSIDYLLKPLSYDALEKALKKLDSLKQILPGKESETSTIDFEELARAISKGQKSCKRRFIVKMRDHIKSIEDSNISFFYAEGRDVFLVTDENRKYIIDYKIEELNDLIEPVKFFRVNRTYIVNIDHITDVIAYSNSRLKVNMVPASEKEIIVSREKVSIFKDWFGGD